jgi:hypothetical protein
MPIPCSRNAHDQNVLVRRAQWDRAWVPFQEREVSELGGTIFNRGRLMRAVEPMPAPIAEKDIREQMCDGRNWGLNQATLERKHEVAWKDPT